MDLNSLNAAQQQAVEESDGQALVIAGAGSGKTRVLTYKIAKLIASGMNPEHILAITFTNKAAKEMKERIVDLVGPIAYSATISTFHAFGARFLRQEISKLGYNRNFVIIDSNDQKALVRSIMSDLNIDVKKVNPRSVINKISSLKNNNVSVNMFKTQVNTYFDEIVCKVYDQYVNALFTNNSVDFDDLLILPIQILKQFQETQAYYQDYYEYILVDEYQDTNALQYQLVKILSAKHQNIFVVGDGDQSIYSWRGANVYNILNFEKDFTNAKIIMLEQNYRSTKTILKAANNLISHNTLRKPKQLFTDNKTGDLITFFDCVNEKAEAQTIISEVIKLKRQGVSLSDIAILYRTNSQSRVFEEILLTENIPYSIVGSYYFYARKEIKDVLAYLRLLVNPHDNLSFIRAVNEPKRGIGQTTINKLSEIAIANNLSMYDAIDLKYLSTKANQNLSAFKVLLDNLQAYSYEHGISKTISYLLDKTGYLQYISEKNIENDVKREYLGEFINVAKSFEETHEELVMEVFLEEISLVADIKQYEDNENKLMLMTLHGAKGLEYEYVFIAGFEEGILPHRNSLESNEDLEEERRLCYVGITRAKEQLYLSAAKTRMVLGTRMINVKSRFVDEIGGALIAFDNEDSFSSFTYDEKALIKDGDSFNVGDKVVHKMFGEGIILSMDDEVYNVAFNHNYGVKVISKVFNSLEKL